MQIYSKKYVARITIIVPNSKKKKIAKIWGELNKNIKILKSYWSNDQEMSEEQEQKKKTDLENVAETI